MSSPTTLRVVTIDVGHGPFPIPYPRKSTLSAHPAPPRNYIAIAKFFLGSFLLDPETYLRELEYFCFQEAVKCKINLKS
jgi:hypothetical protein